MTVHERDSGQLTRRNSGTFDRQAEAFERQARSFDNFQYLIRELLAEVRHNTEVIERSTDAMLDAIADLAAAGKNVV